MRIAILGAALALAACGTEREPGPADAPQPSPATAPAPDEGTVLEELGEADFAQANLAGELGCSFRRDADALAIWIGRGDVAGDAGAESMIKFGGAVRKLAMAGTGGYDAMADGARFENGGVALAISKTDDEPLAEDPQIAMESPIHPATLTFAVTGEEERTVQGLLECGP